MMEKSVSITLSSEQCIRCGACIDECPEAAIGYLAGNMPVVDGPACTGCAKCMEVCCTGALSAQQGRSHG